MATTPTIIRHLEHIPAHFLHPLTSPVLHIPPSENICPTCWRPYNTSDNTPDPPCHLVRLKACSHIIGSHCLAQCLAHNIITCGLCRAPISQKPIGPRWCTWVLGLRAPFDQCTAWLRDVRYMEAGIEDVEPEHYRWFSDAQDDWFVGRLSWGNALYLWADYMIPAVIDTSLGIGFVVLSRACTVRLLRCAARLGCTATFRGLNKTVRAEILEVDVSLIASLTSLGILSTMGFCRILAMVGIGRPMRRSKWWLDAMYASAVVVASRNLVGRRGMYAAAGVMSINAVVYGGTVAWLLRLGMKGRMV